jgi:hypothetical protein
MSHTGEGGLCQSSRIRFAEYGGLRCQRKNLFAAQRGWCLRSSIGMLFHLFVEELWHSQFFLRFFVGAGKCVFHAHLNIYGRL